MTAAHVVNGMDEITVEGIGGEVVRAKLLSANSAADVALLQLERVTVAMRVARLGDSDSVRVGEQVMGRAVRARLFDERGMDQRPLAAQLDFP
jgi:S1-C subfamily serine protease